MLAADPPSRMASAVSALRRSRSAETSREQPSTGIPHMIMGASSPPGRADGRDRSRLAEPGRLPAGIRPRADAARPRTAASSPYERDYRDRRTAQAVRLDTGAGRDDVH